MKLISRFLFSALLLVVVATRCGSSSSDSGPTFNANLQNGPSLPPMSGTNVLKMTVNGSECALPTYQNKPCVSVTLCSAAGTNCQTINDILLDTGSYGFRIFKSVLNSDLANALQPQTVGGQTVAECVEFGDNSMDWGPVEMADIVLGGEPAVTVPIQVVDPTFSDATKYCPNAETAAQAQFNGILGVGLLAQDCGSDCVTDANTQIYFTCNGSTCTGTTESLANQVQNPIALLPKDNNGLIVELPSVSLGGVTNADGYVILGIGTQTNNQPTSVNSYAADGTAEFQTGFNGATVSSFLDTGSNGLIFPTVSALADCTGNLEGWYCPSSTQTLSATNISSPASSKSPKSIVQFQIGNASGLEGSNNYVFVELGGQASGFFDWGLPFYFGRNVYVGIEGKKSSLGTGPYWAY